MKTINVSLNIGNQVPTNLNATATVFGITESGQSEIGTFQLTTSSQSYEITNDSFNYYYVRAEINSFTIQSGSFDASGTDVVEFITIFTADETDIMLNERLTVTNVYCFTQSMLISDDGHMEVKATDRVLGLSMGMRNNFMSTDGVVSDVIQTSPNALQTNSYPLWNSLGNLTYNCVTSEVVCRKFIEAARNQTQPQTYLSSIFAISREPFTSTHDIFNLMENHPAVFTPSLTELELPEGHKARPDQWTLTIKIHNSGAQNYLIAGPAFVAFDKNDRGWMTNNVVQGTPNSAPYCMVFEPDGKPADFSPVFGGGLIGAGFGVVPDPTGENIYFGSFGWGQLNVIRNMEQLLNFR